MEVDSKKINSLKEALKKREDWSRLALIEGILRRRKTWRAVLKDAGKNPSKYIVTIGDMK